MTHGGVEMGQGLHTKVAQVAASAFNIPLSAIFISETSTDKVIRSNICWEFVSYIYFAIRQVKKEESTLCWDLVLFKF